MRNSSARELRSADHRYFGWSEAVGPEAKNRRPQEGSGLRYSCILLSSLCGSGARLVWLTPESRMTRCLLEIQVELLSGLLQVALGSIEVGVRF